MGRKEAGDTILWECCNPDTSGGKWRRSSRDWPRSNLLPVARHYLFAEPVRGAPIHPRWTSPHESPGMLGLSSRHRPHATSAGPRHHDGRLARQCFRDGSVRRFERAMIRAGQGWSRSRACAGQDARSSQGRWGHRNRDLQGAEKARGRHSQDRCQSQHRRRDSAADQG